MMDYLTMLQSSAQFQMKKRWFGSRPGTFGVDQPKDQDRVQSPHTGKPAPESVEEAKGGTPAHKARDKERRKDR